MADDLQSLIERIRKEAIDKAEAETARMVSQAREKAAALVKEAEEKARERKERAEEESKRFVENAERTLEQAARDLLISVGQGVENILRELVAETTQEALDTETIRRMVIEVVQAYLKRDGAESRIELLVPEEAQEEIVRYFAERYAKDLEQGVKIRADSGLHQGFRIVLQDGAVSHDFTREAIAEALSRFLRPHLAEIVHRAARSSNHGGRDST